MASQEHLEIRANIKFCNDLGKTPTETYELVNITRGENSVCRALVFKWCRRLTDGRQSLEDDAGRGRKSTIAPSRTAVTSIENNLKSYYRMTVRELSEAANVSIGKAHIILTTTLNMRKVLARWVPRLLTDFERDRRVKESQKFLRRTRRQYPAEYYHDIIFNQWQKRHKL